MHFAVRCFDRNFRIHVFSMSAAKFDDSIRTVLDGLVIFEAHDIVVLHVWRRAGFADKFQEQTGDPICFCDSAEISAGLVPTSCSED